MQPLINFFWYTFFTLCNYEIKKLHSKIWVFSDNFLKKLKTQNKYKLVKNREIQRFVFLTV